MRHWYKIPLGWPLTPAHSPEQRTSKTIAMFGEINPRVKAQAPFITIEEALEETRRGRMFILMDDEQRENEGDLCMAAEKVTPEAINFMAKYGRGLICLPMASERIERLGLTMMVGDNQAPLGTAFTISITARRCAGSGISAQDRATTILHAVREDATGAEFFTPGHVYPLRARDGGVLVRTGQTEGAVDLARLAGLKPAGVICEILKEDGSMARRDDLVEFARTHGAQDRHGRRHHRISPAQRDPGAADRGGAPADRLWRVPRLRLSKRGGPDRASGAGEG